MRIRTTYEIVTPESAEHGEVAESGWDDKEGVDCTPDQEDVDEGLDKVDVAFRFLQDEVCHASSSHFHPGIWYTGFEVENYRTGETSTHSFHVAEATEDEERRLYERLKAHLASRRMRL